MGLFVVGSGPQGKPDDTAPLPHAASAAAAAALRSASPSPAADSALAPCWKCGVPNGRTASFCWGCEADLAEAGPFRFAAEPEPAPDLSTGAESHAGLSSAADALADPMPLAATAPVQPAVQQALQPALQPAIQHAVQTHADAGAAFPVLTSVVDADDSVPAFLLPAAPQRRRRPELAVVIACMALAGSGAYLLFPKPDVVAVTAPALVGDAAKAGGFDARVQADAKPNPNPNPHPQAAPPQPEASNASRPKAVLPLVVETPVAVAVQAPAVPALEPAVVPRTQTEPRVATAATAATATRSPVAAVARPSAARPAVAAAITAPRAGTARPANAAAARAQPNPSAVEPARPMPAPLGPCTPTLAALGLCSATPTQAKE